MRPYEIINRQVVKRRIRRKIDNYEKLKVIGITGSFGKTSTKNIFYQLLTIREGRSVPPISKGLSNKTYKTPKSFNTLFGIAKAIDYELNDQYDYFICEMGAYKRGEIKELCQMVPPDIAVLTGINEQHLERFSSQKNTVSAKFEILENLKPNGIGVVNLDSKLVRDNINKTDRKLYGYSLDNNTNDECIDTLRVGEWGIKSAGQLYVTTFTLIYKDKKYSGETKLLGKSHLNNILAATMTALLLGEKITPLLDKIKELKQIPHRLELKSDRGINVIDDTYSSNPDGFKEALTVLSSFEGKKILITPGIVELGKRSNTIHKELGEKAADVCDEIVLVGKSQMTKSLKEGIRENDFKGKIKEVKGDKEVQKYIKYKVKPGSTILLENDLPDQYL